MNKNITLSINVGKSEALSRVVQELLIGGGYRWCGTGPSYFKLPSGDDTIHTSGNGEMGLGGYGGIAITVNAATEFGKLVELLATTVAKPVTLRVGSYTATIKPDKKGVQVGCQYATKTSVKKLVDALEAAPPAASKPLNIIVTGLANKTLATIANDLLGTKRADRWSDGRGHTEMRVSGGVFGSYAHDGFYKGETYNGGFSEGHEFFDIRTQFGALVERINAPKVAPTTNVTISLKGEHERSRKVAVAIDNASKTVTIMRDTVTKAQIDAVWAALQ